MDTDNRQHPRFPFRESVAYQTGGSPSCGSLAGDISEGGLRLTVREFIPLNTIISLNIRLSDPVRVVPARGRVVWVMEDFDGERFDVGIEFIVDPDNGILKGAVERHGRRTGTSRGR